MTHFPFFSTFSTSGKICFKVFIKVLSLAKPSIPSVFLGRSIFIQKNFLLYCGRLFVKRGNYFKLRKCNISEISYSVLKNKSVHLVTSQIQTGLREQACCSANPSWFLQIDLPSLLIVCSNEYFTSLTVHASANFSESFNYLQNLYEDVLTKAGSRSLNSNLMNERTSVWSLKAIYRLYFKLDTIMSTKVPE